jgi:hypothetical protein
VVRRAQPGPGPQLTRPACTGKTGPAAGGGLEKLGRPRKPRPIFGVTTSPMRDGPTFRSKLGGSIRRNRRPDQHRRCRHVTRHPRQADAGAEGGLEKLGCLRKPRPIFRVAAHADVGCPAFEVTLGPAGANRVDSCTEI